MLFFLIGGMKKLDIKNSVFEGIKHIDENGNEFWYARELGKVMKYSEYRKFLPVIEKRLFLVKIVMNVLVIISSTWAE